MTTKLELYFGSDHSMVATVGGGVTTAQILHTLRILYMGGVYVHKKVAEHIVCGEGPSRFFSCHRYRIRPDKAASILARDVLAHMQRDWVTYEVGLRWFLNSPAAHLPQSDRSRKIAVLPPQPLVIDGHPQILLFYGGGDGPCITLVGFDLEDKWPDWDFLMAHELQPNPYCS